MEIFRRNNVRFIAINNGIDSKDQNTLEFAPFINIMSEWYARDISKKVTTGIKTKGASGKPVATEAPYGYIKDPKNKDYWIVDKEAAEVVNLIFRLFMDGKNRNQIAVYLKDKEILTPTFYMKQQDRGTAKNRKLNEENRYNWNKVTLTRILQRQEYCGDVVNFKTEKHYKDKRNHYVDKSKWKIIENVHEPIIDRITFENVQRILKNAPVKRPNGDGEIHPLSGLMYCKDCGTKMHIHTIHKSGKVQHITYCSEYAKGKAKHPKCNSPHRIDVDDVMETITEVLRKIAQYSLANKGEFEALAESYSDFEELTSTAINEFISKIVVHERDVKRAKYAVQRIEVYFNYIGRFENELTKDIEPTEEEMIQMREKIEEAKKEKSRAYHRAYSKKYRAKNIEKFREYERIKAREYRARKKLQATT